MSREISILDAARFQVDKETIIEAGVPDFDPDGRFHPLKHQTMIEQTEQLIQQLGHTIEEESFFMTDDELRAIGVYQFKSKLAEDYRNMILFFNANDRSSATKMAAGKMQLVCLNGCISGEMVYKTFHTKYIQDRLPNLLAQAITQIGGYIDHQERQHLAYKKTPVTTSVSDFGHTDDGNSQGTEDAIGYAKFEHQQRVDHLIMRATREKIIATSSARHVEHHYWNPQHSEFTENGFSLHRIKQAFTSTMNDKNYSFKRMSQGTMNIHKMLNEIYADQLEYNLGLVDEEIQQKELMQE